MINLSNSLKIFEDINGFICNNANSSFSEDTGFAIKGWNAVRWENAGIKIMKDCAVCMGNYFFGMKNQEDLKV